MSSALPRNELSCQRTSTSQVRQASDFEWLFDRSPQGGTTWLDAYDALLAQLVDRAEVFAEAFENNECPEFDVRQAFFKTRRGRVYRLLYFIDGNEVYVLRIRGPGQAAVDPNDLKQHS